MSKKVTMAMPTNPADRKAVKGKIEEVAHSLVRKQAEMDHMKTIKKDLKKSYGLSSKLITRLAKAYNENNYDEVASDAEAEVEEFTEAYELLFKKQ